MNASVAIETITPAQAAKWLENRFEGQRKVRDPHVQRLAKTIQNGDWRLTCDAVTLIKGKLGNGQHRCEAIVLSGKPCEALVLRTTDDRLFGIMDSGITRTVADVLGQEGIGFAIIVAAAARTSLSYERGLMSKTTVSNTKAIPGTRVKDTITRQDVIGYVNANQEKLHKFASLVSKLYSKSSILSQTLATAFLQIAYKTNETQAIKFINALYIGEGASAATDIRNRLIKNKMSRTKMKSAYVFGILIKAFKAFLADERPGKYLIGDAEEFPVL